jgi:hypothetical protein
MTSYSGIEASSSRGFISRGYVAILSALLLTACGSQGTRPQQSPVDENLNVADLHIVDCLLPGQLRRLGGTSYMTARRPVQTTAADCRIRGGEYVAYDRADYRTALTVWLPSAEEGDAEAQTNVGEIFERGLGGSPNHEAAAIWYRKAAEQGNKRAQFNLGTLYEQGLGVEQSQLQALNWYRQAWGLEEDSLIYQSAANAAQDELRQALEQSLNEKSTRIRLLNNQITALQQSVSGDSGGDTQLREELAQLRLWVQRLEQERTVARLEYDAIPRFREPEAHTDNQEINARATASVSLADMEFGRYYALIIANQNYRFIEDLHTPYSDARRARDILEKQFGFNVKLLLDADNISVMKAINELNEQLTDQDNLLIFYAGHGSRIHAGELETGYWLPVNASPPPDDTFWVSNEFVTRHLARLKAKRVMVIADSCYAGLLSSAPGYLFMGDARYNEDYVRYKLPNRSRLLLSSGGDAPVLDNIGEGHSIFARAFLDVLEEADRFITAPELFLKVRQLVTERARDIDVEQTPEFKAIKGAGHEVGDFFFVRSH